MASVAQASSSPTHNSSGTSPTAASTSGNNSSSSSSAASSNNHHGHHTSQHPPASATKSKDIASLVPSAANCSYAPCFCEENVWKICDHVRRTSPAELPKCHVVFVSNKKQVVPLWKQKAGKDEEKLVIWDYHVLFIYRPDDRCLVFDLDSDLPFPTYFHKYVTETFRTDAILNQEYHRFFRVVPAPLFLQRFASDRRHMKKPDGSWMKPPPPYPAIQTSDSRHNLDEFISMDASVGCGDVVSLKDFVTRFHKK